MKLHDTCAIPIGKTLASLTAGEGRTMTAIVAGVEPNEQHAFVLISMVECEVCGTVRVLIDSDMTDMAEKMNMLTQAMIRIIEDTL